MNLMINYKICGEVYIVKKNDMSRHKYTLKAINKKFIHFHKKARSIFLEK